MPTSHSDDDIDWNLTTWESSRRAQLRYALSLTVRERLQVVADLTEVASHMAAIGRTSESLAAAAVSSAPIPGNIGIRENQED